MAVAPGLDASKRSPSPVPNQIRPSLSPRPSQRRASKSSIGSDRPPTPVSKSSVKNSQSSAQPATQSTLLQEKLQEERKNEIQRNLTRLAGEIGAANEPRAAPATPARSATGDGTRPEVTDDVGDGQVKGLALKEMGQTMSTLHKQNFDLKLELFHRRQRQAVLEQKIEMLEEARANVEESNVKLVEELEKRDKAVGEAVQMIVALEARIELLLREREMTRQVEANQTLLSQLNASAPTTLISHGAASKPQEDTTPTGKHSLHRMPSFLSERTEDTENLRNVYLDPNPSYLSLTKTDSRVGNNGFVSPSMSILSESSFVSIYGQRTMDDSPSPPDAPSAIHNRLKSSGQRSVSLPIKDYAVGRTQSGDRPESRVENKHQIQSPGQRKEQPDASPHAILRTTASGSDIERSKTVRPTKPPQVLSKIRKETERPIRKLITDDPGPNYQGLPPTPDTMTSSMINGQAQTRDSSLRRDPVGNDPTTYPVLSRLTLDQTDEVEPGHWRFKSPDIAQPPSITAFTGRKGSSGATAYYENRAPNLRRPRSADESTISRHHTDWDSCSDADDLCSEASSFDYWMKEGLRPSRGATVKGQTRTFSSQIGSSRDPPDLFSFPSDGQSWQSNEIFGALDGTGFFGVGSPVAPAMDALGASLPAPETGLYGSGLAGTASPRPHGVVAAPPAPNRRSSLKARTSAPGTPTTTRTPVLHGKGRDFDPSRQRSVSGHALSSPKPNGWPSSNDARSKSPNPPARPQAQLPEVAGQKRHYPPHASQPQTTPRPRSRGITSLFRRSLGSAPPQPSSSVPPSTSQSPFAPPPASRQDLSPLTVGIPNWERRHDQAEDEASATPPPIVRNRGGTRESIDFNDGEEVRGGRPASSQRGAGGSTSSSSNPGLGSGLSKVVAARDGGVALTPARNQADDEEHDSAQSNQGHGRRWFNLSRVTNNHKNAVSGT
ncbi:hypothetical protein N0V82_005989 [Gnomoniopsis sp. IMI 355080]|nr:hypothetical protein N0V82_005989 [Gnomoniopsis sp. IMI 355080]